MALMMGIRLGLAGAALLVTHESTKLTTEKLYQWVAEKLRRRSPDPATPTSNSGKAGVNHSDDAVNGETAAEPFPSDSDQVNPLTDNAIDDGGLTAEPFQSEEVKLRPGAPDLPAVVGAISIEDVRELPSQTDSENGVNRNLTAGPVQLDAVKPSSEGPDLARADGDVLVPLQSDACDAVKGDPAAEPPQSDAAKPSRVAPELAPTCRARATHVAYKPEADPNFALDPPPATGVWAAVRAWVRPELASARGARETHVPCQMDADPAVPPDPPPAMGAWAAVTAWVRKLFRWAAGKPKFSTTEPDPGSHRVPGLAGWMLDPGVRDKICRILKKLLWLAGEYVCISVIKRNKVWLQVYRVVKAEMY